MKTRKQLNRSSIKQIITCTQLGIVAQNREQNFSNDTAKIAKQQNVCLQEQVIWLEDIEFLQQIYQFANSFSDFDEKKFRKEVQSMLTQVKVNQLLCKTGRSIWGMEISKQNLIRYVKTVEILRISSQIDLIILKKDNIQYLLWKDENGGLNFSQADPNAIKAFSHRQSFLDKLREKQDLYQPADNGQKGEYLRDLTQQVLWLYKQYLINKKELLQSLTLIIGRIPPKTNKKKTAKLDIIEIAKKANNRKRKLIKK